MGQAPFESIKVVLKPYSMAIHFWEIKKLVEELQRRQGSETPTRVLSLGHPTMNILENILQNLVGPELFKKLRPLKSDPVTLRRHDKTGLIKTLFCPHSLVESMGGKMDVLDVKAWEGYELVGDLNSNLPSSFKNQFDIVIDPGTIEHCFNVATAIWNISTLLRIGGLVIHNNPLTMINHGFYNLNPEFYEGFYTHNGFTIEDLYTVIPHESSFSLFKTKSFGRIYPAVKENRHLPIAFASRFQSNIDIEAPLKEILSQMIFVTARKQKNRETPTWPIQKKYQKT